jgi:hypothetical protein
MNPAHSQAPESGWTQSGEDAMPVGEAGAPNTSGVPNVGSAGAQDTASEKS